MILQCCEMKGVLHVQKKADDPALLAGYLLMSEDTGRTWNKRWLALHQDFVMYFFKARQVPVTLAYITIALVFCLHVYYLYYFLYVLLPVGLLHLSCFFVWFSVYLFVIHVFFSLSYHIFCIFFYRLLYCAFLKSVSHAFRQTVWKSLLFYSTKYRIKDPLM